MGVRTVLALAVLAALAATAYAYTHDIIVAYGDAESHLNIAKRVVDSITPGFAQLGGIWLPLPHLINLVPVQIDFFYRTGAFAVAVSIAAFGLAGAE